MAHFHLIEYSIHSGIPVFWQWDSQGLSDESEQLTTGSIRASIHYYFPITRETLAQKFRALADTWQEETGHISSPIKIAMHPAYQQIIGMGRSVIPLILHDISREPKQWFWALTSITGINPVPRRDQGRIKKMVEAWLRWGRDEGYL
jgi:hypothetical protein